MLQTRGLTKRFGTFTAVDDLNLHVRQGEIYGFLGPNGAGKTTSIMMILGLLRPTAGDISLFGQPLTKELFHLKHRIGVLSEFQYLYEDMTAWEYLAFFADMYQVKGKRDRIAEVLDKVHLFDRKDELLHSYSKGMKQKLGLVRALLHRPELLILDEPQSSLDPHGIREVRDVLLEENRRGTTMLISSHILSEIERTCHRVGIMNKGRLVAEDTMNSLRRRLSDEIKVDVGLEAAVKGLIPKLQSLSWVVAVTGDDIRFTVTTQADRDYRGELSKAVFAAGGTVVEMHQHEMSLEEAFLTITEKNISLLTEGDAA